MKKFINRTEDVVEEMLQGMLVLHPGSDRLLGYKTIVRGDAERVSDQCVAVISGGGSGHEPAHAGYVGMGMLNAAVAGEVFTSPSSDSVLSAIKAVATKSGVLLVVKNYTGDRLNFGVAAEMARSEGISVEMIIVDDDVALKGTDQATGARGLAGTVFIRGLPRPRARAWRTSWQRAKPQLSLWQPWVFHFRRELHPQLESPALSSASVRWSLASVFTENLE